MNVLVVDGLSKSFDDVQALDEISFDVEEGEFFCVVGPTNAGKSTLLRTIAGLYPPDGGRILLKGRDVAGLEPKDRNVSLLFQNIALFPNLTGADNIAFPLRMAGMADAEIKARVSELAAMLKVGHVLHRLPRTFSGGEQQRVAIGRAIAKPADLLMLDEPLTNLDARIRMSLRIEFKDIHRRLGQTVVYVTHDQIEAMSMSDRIGILHQGRFQQIGSPAEIYERPVNRFVAAFFGQPPMNLLAATIRVKNDVTGVDVGGNWFAMQSMASLRSFEKLPQALAVGVRPEAVRVSPAESTETPHHAEVGWVENLGNKSIIELHVGENILRAKVAPDDAVLGSASAWFGFQPRPEHLMDQSTGVFFR